METTYYWLCCILIIITSCLAIYYKNRYDKLIKKLKKIINELDITL